MEYSQTNGSKSLLYSLLLSMENAKDHELSIEDILYSHFPRVTECQVRIYTLVIQMLSSGKTYEEIYDFIENYNHEEYNILDDKQRHYIKTRVLKDVKTRQIKEGEINYE